MGRHVLNKKSFFQYMPAHDDDEKYNFIKDRTEARSFKTPLI